MSRRTPAKPPVLEGFEYVELLGLGGFADVHKYRQLGLGRTVAVKVLFRGLGESAQRSFEAEANVMAQLSNHPSIVSIYQAGAAADGRPFLVMEYCPPPALDKRVRAKPLSVAKALEVIIQISGAIETAHRLGILHRDVKPANILFTEFNRPALTDFGISITQDAAAQGEAVGYSLPWAPPEQLVDGGDMSPSSDVYALAATLWTLLVGRSPFEVPGGDNGQWAMATRVRTQASPRTGRVDVPDSLERVMRVAMAKSPPERYSSAVEFARALQAVQVELHHSTTSLDIRQDDVTELVDDASDAGGTRISGYALIDPDGSGTSTQGRSTIGAPAGDTVRGRLTSTGGAADPVLQHGRGSAQAVAPLEFTAPRPQKVADGPTPAIPVPVSTGSPSGRNRKYLLPTVGAVAAVAVAAGGYVAFGRSTPATTADRSPSASAIAQDPIGDVPPAPANITGKVGGSMVVFSWTNPRPKAGDSFLYGSVDNDSDAQLETTTAMSVSLPKQAGRTCIQVKVLRSSGRASEPAKKCVDS